MRKQTTDKIAVIGAGLAGCEAAWQLAKRGFWVSLFEMRPQKMTPAHKSGDFAELVCSNSFKSLDLSNAHGLLKEELKRAGSIILDSATKCALPAGGALAVDRDSFSGIVKQTLELDPHISVIRQEVTDPFELKGEFSQVVIATGPLTSDSLSNTLRDKIGENELYFYDAIAPVLYTESIDMGIAFKASRYGKGSADYINCPLSEDIYFEFVQDLIESEKLPFNSIDQEKHFEGCLPIEVMASRGINTLAFGPMKPVGLEDPNTGKQAFAVLQLRQENSNGSLYNLVGCQTRMTWAEQKRVFQKIPALKNCDFARYGSMHRNTYINAPRHLNDNLEFIKFPGIYLSGQITGVEGYTESTAMGLWVAMTIAGKLRGDEPVRPDPQTMLGGLVNHLQNASPDKFQPMNANFGLVPPAGNRGKLKKKERRLIQAERALKVWDAQISDWNKGG